MTTTLNAGQHDGSNGPIAADTAQPSELPHQHVFTEPAGPHGDNVPRRTGDTNTREAQPRQRRTLARSAR